MKIWIINGPNLNLLGKREPNIYGSISFEDFFEKLKIQFNKLTINYFQSNHEGVLIDKIHEIGFEKLGIVINPGAYTHTSIAIRDAIAAISVPVFEVHISNIIERESFRQINYIRDVAVGSVEGMGLNGYAIAIERLIRILEKM